MTNGTVPQFPGKGGQATPGKPGPTQPVAPWQKAMCPFLTAGEIARHKDNLVVTAGVQPAGPAGQACKGPMCMLFVTVKTADGNESMGCAPVHQFSMSMALHAQLQMLNGQVFEFIAAAKAGAAAEAAAAAGTPAPTTVLPPPGLAVVPNVTLVPEPSPPATETPKSE